MLVNRHTIYIPHRTILHRDKKSSQNHAINSLKTPAQKPSLPSCLGHPTNLSQTGHAIPCHAVHMRPRTPDDPGAPDPNPRITPLPTSCLGSRALGPSRAHSLTAWTQAWAQRAGRGVSLRVQYICNTTVGAHVKYQSERIGFLCIAIAIASATALTGLQGPPLGNLMVWMDGSYRIRRFVMARSKEREKREMKRQDSVV